MPIGRIGATPMAHLGACTGRRPFHAGAMTGRSTLLARASLVRTTRLIALEDWNSCAPARITSAERSSRDRRSAGRYIQGTASCSAGKAPPAAASWGGGQYDSSFPHADSSIARSVCPKVPTVTDRKMTRPEGTGTNNAETSAHAMLMGSSDEPLSRVAGRVRVGSCGSVSVSHHHPLPRRVGRAAPRVRSKPSRG